MTVYLGTYAKGKEVKRVESTLDCLRNERLSRYFPGSFPGPGSESDLTETTQWRNISRFTGMKMRWAGEQREGQCLVGGFLRAGRF